MNNMIDYILYSPLDILGELSAFDLWEVCIKESLADVVFKIIYMSIYNVLFSYLLNVLPVWQFPYLSIFWGHAILNLAITSTNIIHFHVFIGFGYILIYCANHAHKMYSIKIQYLIPLACIVYLLLCEFLHPNANDWIQSRGIFMIATMKLMSLDFDWQNSHQIPNLVKYFGYMCCPANVLFGPWTSYEEYKSVLIRRRKKGIHWITRLLKVFSLSFIFLSISNCLSLFVLPKDIENRWTSAYRFAFSFRCSHYFVSYLSEVMMLCAGYSDEKNQGATWGYTITRPLSIEFPSSLVNVVVNWNIPMHKFLKKYVYMELLKFGYFKAIFGTFLISSLLHGFNIEIATVLLTISLYSYVQFQLQEKLSREYNACLHVRHCKNCNHKYKRTNLVVKLVHTFFALVTVFNLIYLGILMDSVGFSDSPSIYEKWKRLDFLSHWLMLSLYIITFL